MKRICNLLIVALMLLLAVNTVGCAAKFDLSSFKVSPGVCLAGDAVTVSVALTNSSNVQGEYAAELVVNGAVEQTQSVILEPGASQSLSFTLMKHEPGKYVVQLGEIEASFTVLGVGNIEVSPSEVEIGQPVTVAVELRNAAEIQATYHCRLVCQGKDVEAKDITLAGNSTEKATFKLSRASSGTYGVELLGRSGSFGVIRPAEFTVRSLDVSPNPVNVGEEATIRATIENTGEAKGTYNAALRLGGSVYYTRDITLEGGASGSVSVALSKNSPGIYRVEMGGREASLRVIQTVRLETGTVVTGKTGGGDTGSLKVENGLDLDAVVVLVSTKDPETPMLAVYVRSGDSYKVRSVGTGRFTVYFACGRDWDTYSKEFTRDREYKKFEELFNFAGYNYTITLHKVVGGSAHTETLGEGEFPNL